MQLTTRNVNTGFYDILKKIGVAEIPTIFSDSRYGNVVVVPEPVLITYTRPWERVLLNKTRDANPFFHLFEALWMLAGRDDVSSLAYYNKKMAEFSDDGTKLNSAYGPRWRRWPNGDKTVDQLDVIIDHLRKVPNSRRAVLQIWSVDNDLSKISTGKDISCNTQVYFSIIQGRLQTTVCNRSNDLIWGTFGSDYMTFSMLHEYVADCLGLPMGNYNQFTNNLHAYSNIWNPKVWLSGFFREPLLVHQNPLVINRKTFDVECQDFIDRHSQDSMATNYNEPFIAEVAQPMAITFHHWKAKRYEEAMSTVNSVQSEDWQLAARWWLERRIDAKTH